VIETKPRDSAANHLPPVGPACQDPTLEEGQPGFAIPTTDIGAIVGVWFDAGGRPLSGVWNDPTSPPELSLYPTPPYCEVEGALILELAWPVGAPIGTGTKSFVRDETGRLGDPFATLDALPDGAVNTGYHRGEWSLHVSPIDEESVYLTNGDSVERWPAAVADSPCVDQRMSVPSGQAP
jgi:hypothetical protein